MCMYVHACICIYAVLIVCACAGFFIYVHCGMYTVSMYMCVYVFWSMCMYVHEYACMSNIEYVFCSCVYLFECMFMYYVGLLKYGHVSDTALVLRAAWCPSARQTIYKSYLWPETSVFPRIQSFHLAIAHLRCFNSALNDSDNKINVNWCDTDQNFIMGLNRCLSIPMFSVLCCSKSRHYKGA